MAGSQTADGGTPASPPPICAIGASAGGVRALQDFFSKIDDDLGLTYVVVVHLSPEHPSQLASIIGGRTRMPVEQVGDAPPQSLRPNCVYVIAPDRELVVASEKLVSRPITEQRGKRSPIDTFFRSVAAARGDGLAVVLSGAGSDGALGVPAMKEAGSVILVQDPEEAEYAAMPRNAIATGLVDFVAPIPVLVRRIAEVVRTKKALRRLNEEDAEQGLPQILRLLHTRTGHDFSHYKRSTVMRRVARRMQVTRHDSIGSYAEFLREKPQESQELLADLLISVTRFFRNHSSFETVAKDAIRSIFEKAEETGGIRVWVVGCATGEEAYSMAILMLEEAARSNVQVPVQIFASDLDEKALKTAREGRYPQAIAADVSEERLRRFFVREDEHYRIRKEVRELIVFAKHDALKDPPFLRNDLITCRNLLIYLDREMQRQLCSVLHYALRPDGYLFLGPAEDAESMPELFRLIDRDAQLYAAKRTGEHAVPVLPQFAPEHNRARSTHGRIPERIDSAATVAGIHLSALERQSPPSMLVDADYRLRHLSPNAGRFVRPPGGTITDEVCQLVRPELRLDLKLALQRAFEQKQSTLTLPILMENEAGERRRVLVYVALTDAGEDAPPYALVLFLDAGAPSLEDAGGVDADEKRRLLHELAMAQERLNASQTQHEQAVQELRGSNQELQSINEEYRSTSEELETSKEELQSVNEELKTVNAELKSELDKVSAAHSDLRNLVAETEIGTLFLDQQLRIKLFTPPIAEYFSITQADLDRAITDFTHRLIYEGIGIDAKRVLESLVPIRAELKTRDGRWLMMRMRPYRTVENVINGVVVTFTDVTELKRVEESLRNSENRLRQVLETETVGMLFFADDGTLIDANKAFLHMTGYSRAQIDARELTWRQMTPPEWIAVSEEQFAKMETSGHLGPYEKEYFRSDGSRGWMHFVGRRLDDGTIAEYCIDISDRKRAERERELLARELSHRVKNTLAVVEALAQQSTGESVEEFREKFGGRLRALSQAHASLLDSDWRSIDLNQLLEEALSAYRANDPRRVEIDGAPISMTPKQALSLRLIVHELATNAVKYGALSRVGGTVRLSWQIEQIGDRQLRVRLHWEERGGPKVKAPERTGFGARLIKTVCEHDLEGEARLDYTPEGLICEIALPTA
jgi:two-component system, chemotaxis family, CheB/CheR fusion protein